MMTRRTFVALGAVTGGLVVAGVTLVANGYKSWIADVLHRALPGYSLDPGGLDRFIAEYQSRHSGATKFQLLGAVENIFHARSLLQPETADYVESEERKVLTEFLVGSDFFEQYPKGKREITFNERAVACKSPFAVFDL